jgi:transcriptional regulator with XRE-family HTH domain
MVGSDLRTILSRNIKLYRNRRSLSQAELAARADISIAFLSNIERANKWPYPDTLVNIAKSLDIEVWELFKDETISNERKTLIDRLSDDVKRQVIGVLDEVFGQYQG